MNGWWINYSFYIVITIISRIISKEIRITCHQYKWNATSCQPEIIMSTSMFFNWLNFPSLKFNFLFKIIRTYPSVSFFKAQFPFFLFRCFKVARWQKNCPFMILRLPKHPFGMSKYSCDFPYSTPVSYIPQPRILICTRSTLYLNFFL